MPELPEVETIKKQLEKTIKRKLIKKVFVKAAKILKTPPKEFQRAVLNYKINDLRRRAKILIINLSSGYSLLIHLKMTGQLIYKKLKAKNKNLEEKHTHVIFAFSDNSQLLYNDIRKFGWIKLIKTDEIEKYLQKKKYGPEPLENSFALPILKEILDSKPRWKIKQFLMEQKNIAGVGNIYADEICFCAGVRPTRINKSFSEKEIRQIYNCTKSVLTEAIKYRGSSVDNYVDSRGKAGEYHLRLKVYGRASQKCLKCNNNIQKIKLAGRGTHFCPTCQR